VGGCAWLPLLRGPSTSPLESTYLPFNPIVSSPNLRALGLGVLSYFMLGLIVGYLLAHLAHPVGAVVLSIFSILPGVVVGIAAKRSPLMHGILLGFLIVIVMAIVIVIAGALGVDGTPMALHDLGSMAVVTIIALVISCSFGAVLGDFIGDKLRGL
jgi:hypothetical protein